ncbi:MAG: ribosome assembly cofactor RimP [Candidatus Cloacimonadales bacterium]|nr:ribosome assembly cofactor RimP [Candidatus Cloacimonadales bacterium]
MEKIMVERIEKIAREACSLFGIALYDLELKHAAKGQLVLIYITKISGVTIDDCRNVSRAISDVLEEEDFIEERYFLEVSSPGLERELKLKKHYVSAIGELAKITYHQDDKNVTEIALIEEILPDHLKVKVHELEKEIPFSSIKKAKTYFDYKKEERGEL